jgi:hypothetical protein
LVLNLSTEGIISESCRIMGSSDAQVTDTFVSPSDTYIVPVDTNVTPQITDVVPEEFGVRTNLLCESFTAMRECRRTSGRVTQNRP